MASRWAGEVAASGQSMNAVPRPAAAAPAASTAAIPRPVATPPIPTSAGPSPTAARTSWSSAIRPMSPGGVVVGPAAVTARFDALHDQGVCADAVRGLRFARCGHRDPNRHVGSVQTLDVLR